MRWYWDKFSREILHTLQICAKTTTFSTSIRQINKLCSVLKMENSPTSKWNYAFGDAPFVHFRLWGKQYNFPKLHFFQILQYLLCCRRHGEKLSYNGSIILLSEVSGLLNTKWAFLNFLELPKSLFCYAITSLQNVFDFQNAILYPNFEKE